MTILEIIKKKRNEKSLTQEHMGSSIGIAKETYRDIENGILRLKVDDFIKICSILDIPLSAFSNAKSNIIELTDEDVNDLKKAQKILEKINDQVNIIHNMNIHTGDVSIGNESNVIIGKGSIKK